MTDEKVKVSVAGTNLVGVQVAETHGGSAKKFNIGANWNVDFVPVYFAETHEVRWFEKSAIQPI